MSNVPPFGEESPTEGFRYPQVYGEGSGIGSSEMLDCVDMEITSGRVVVVGADCDKGKIAIRRNELVLGHFRLSVWAQRLFLILVAHVDAATDETTTFRFQVSELARMVGIDRSKLYSDLVGAIYELERTKVNIDRIDGKPGYLQVGLVQNKQAFSGSDGKALRVADGSIEFFLHRELMPYIKELSSRFSQTELVYALRLRSSFSQKMYDILKANRWRGMVYEVGMDELKGMLALKDGEYAKFGDFRRNVLEVSEKEINQKTDVRFNWEAQKHGKRVGAVRFHFSGKPGAEIEFLPGTQNDALLQRLVRAGVKAEKAADIIRLYGSTDPARIAWHLDEALRKYKAGKLKSPAGWILSGIKKDYRPQRSLFEVRGEVHRPHHRRQQLREERHIGEVVSQPPQ